MSADPRQIIFGQVQYLGPQVLHIGLGYGNLFRNGIHPHFYAAIKACPALAELFVPVEKVAEVRRELNFDIARQMKGTSGRYVTFYREIERWLAELAKKKLTSSASSGVTFKHHA